MPHAAPRSPRLAFLLVRGLDHFAPDLIARLPAATGRQVRAFTIGNAEDLAAALAWADEPETDALWFEFCWPPFPQLIAQTDFAGRRVIVRVHRIEAVEAPYVGQTPWEQVSDAIVVGPEMAARVRRAAPALEKTTRLSVIPNGVDTERFVPRAAWDRFRIGWCGSMIARKNPSLALQVLFALRLAEPRYRLHMCAMGGDALTTDSFLHLADRLDLREAIHMDGRIAQADMPAWHAANGVLLHTSLHESFGYAIGEAAAAGADLCVLDHPGADAFWPDAVRFGSVEEAAWLIREAAPHRWREHVSRNFGLDRQIAATAALLRDAPARAPGFDSAAYWEERYRRGGNSGAGSAGRLARFKAEVLNGFVARAGVASVAEFGCGDGGQLALAAYPDYTGVDVSPTALALCRQRFGGDATKRFLRADEAGSVRADLALSLDVVFHLVEDAVFERYMRALFAAAGRYVVIYASDRDQRTADRHVRHRAFSDWIAAEAPGWRRVEIVPNPYPFDPGNPHETSFADFHVFAREAG